MYTGRRTLGRAEQERDRRQDDTQNAGPCIRGVRSDVIRYFSVLRCSAVVSAMRAENALHTSSIDALFCSGTESSSNRGEILATKWINPGNKSRTQVRSRSLLEAATVIVFAQCTATIAICVFEFRGRDDH